MSEQRRLALDARESVLAPLLVPPAVSFVLVFVTSDAPGARPLRVLASYVIAGTVALAWAAHRVLGDERYPTRWW